MLETMKRKIAYFPHWLSLTTVNIPKSEVFYSRTSGRDGSCHNRFLLLSVLTVLMSRSEAFASPSRSLFFGRQLLHKYRGGYHQESTRLAASNRDDDDDKKVLATNLNDLKCVMQQLPPTANGYTKNGHSNNGESEQNWLHSFSSTGSERQNYRNGRKKQTLSSPSLYGFPAASSSRSRIKPVEFVAETKLPTEFGQFQLRAYRVPGAPLGQDPCVIYYRTKPPFGGSSAVPVRIHDQCLTSEVFGSQRCDCKEQLNMAMQYIKEHGGIIIYLQQEGRGIGLANKIAAYSLQDHGLDTVDANLHLGFPDDAREYFVVPSILKDMQISRISLMTNNPRKTKMLTELGVVVEETLPMVIPETNPYNRRYMETKASRMDHQNMARLFVDTVKSSGTDDSTSPPGSAAERLAVANGMMAPRRFIRTSENGDSKLANNNDKKDISDVTAMPENAVQVSLEVMENNDINGVVLEEPNAGIKARDDGYCLGRQSVLLAIEAIKRGEMVVVVDDLDRENEGDFIMAADRCTDLDMAKIIRYSSGVVCIGMEGKRMDELNLPAMVTNNEDPKGTAFSVSVDATKEHGITTGISARDRATTLRLLADPQSKPDDFHRPGHIFPLRAVDGGVLARDGHTEASVDLARLAGLNPAGVLCEIVSEENPTEMMRLPEIKRFCAKHGFVLTSIVDLAQYRREIEQSQCNDNQ